jgi:hypothetical protein
MKRVRVLTQRKEIGNVIEIGKAAGAMLRDRERAWRFQPTF